MTTPCATDKLWLSIWEINPFSLKPDGSYTTIGSESTRILTQAEVSNMLSSGGLNITTFQARTIVPGKSYTIKMAYNGQNVCKPTYKMLQYKTGNYDLVMEDYIGDNGIEPSVRGWTIPDFYHSPFLWNKLSNTLNQTNQVNENPQYVNIAGNFNNMMVKVKNIGCVASPSTAKLNLYWTLARTSELWSIHWKYNTTINGFLTSSGVPVPLGSETTISGATFTNNFGIVGGLQTPQPFPLPSIAPNTTYTMPFSSGVNWFPPKPSDYTPNSSVIFQGIDPVLCFLARIEDVLDPIGYEPLGNTTLIKPYVVNNNNVATRNSFLTDYRTFKQVRANGTFTGPVGSVIITNPLTPGITYPTPTMPRRNICIDLLPHAYQAGLTFNDFGNIELLLTDGLWNTWAAENFNSVNITIPQSATPVPVLMNGTLACFNNVLIPQNENILERLAVRFVCSPENLPNEPVELSYRLSVIPTNDYIAIFDTLNVDLYSGCNSIFDVIVPARTPNPSFTAIDKVTSTTKVLAFPNPANASLTIQTDFVVINTLEIFDITGKLMYLDNNPHNTFTINTQEWNNGVYFVKVTTPTSVQTVKVQILK